MSTIGHTNKAVCDRSPQLVNIKGIFHQKVLPCIFTYFIMILILTQSKVLFLSESLKWFKYIKKWTFTKNANMASIQRAANTLPGVSGRRDHKGGRPLHYPRTKTRRHSITARPLWPVLYGRGGLARLWSRKRACLAPGIISSFTPSTLNIYRFWLQQ